MVVKCILTNLTMALCVILVVVMMLLVVQSSQDYNLTLILTVNYMIVSKN